MDKKLDKSKKKADIKALKKLEKALAAFCREHYCGTGKCFFGASISKCRLWKMKNELQWACK